MDCPKHAYLILAHNDLPLLELLVSYLDFEVNDIYIHIDRKAAYDGSTIKTSKSRLFILLERMNARWGDVSLVQVQLDLLKAASVHGQYSYYHFLSGVDLPLKSQEYIHSFCLKNNGKEFIGFVNGDRIATEVDRRVCRYHLFARRFQSNNMLIRSVRKMFIELQILLGIRRNKGIDFKKGPQWCSITNDFALFLLQKEKDILHIFSHTYAPDEFFVQTIAWNSDFRERIYNTEDEFEGCLRFINWKDGVLRPFEIYDIDGLFKSDKWFARKFSSCDSDLLNKYRMCYNSYIS